MVGKAAPFSRASTRGSYIYIYITIQETQYFRPLTPDEFDHLHSTYPPVRDGCMRHLRLAMGDQRDGRRLLADFAADR